MNNARILIVEDEAITVAALRRELVAMGYQVAGSAGTADEAFRVARHQQPDLVLMDITLSGELDGIAVASALRGDLGIPVVFLTAHQDDRTLERAVLAGPYGYLLKPFTRPELKAAIAVALQKHRSEMARAVLTRA